MNVLAAALAPLLVCATPAIAQDHAAHQNHAAPAEPADPHAAHGAAPAPQPHAAPQPAAPAHAADLYFDPADMARAREQMRIENGQVITHAIIIEQLEAAFDDGHEGYAWAAQGWYGGDIHRFWWKSEGEGAIAGELEGAELQLLYSRAVTPYFDVQAGVRQSYANDQDRTDFVVGVQGLAPHWFEVGAEAFLSTKGDLTARAEAEYDLRLTQRLILQPSSEIHFAAQDVPALALGAGVTDIELGLRLRYEVNRRFAPYIGLEWASAVGETRSLRQAGGSDAEAAHALIGVRAWF